MLRCMRWQDDWSVKISWTKILLLYHSHLDIIGTNFAEKQCMGLPNMSHEQAEWFKSGLACVAGFDAYIADMSCKVVNSLLYGTIFKESFRCFIPNEIVTFIRLVVMQSIDEQHLKHTRKVATLIHPSHTECGHNHKGIINNDTFVVTTTTA